MNSGFGYLKSCEKAVATTDCHYSFDSFDTWPSRDHVGVEVPSNFKRLSQD